MNKLLPFSRPSSVKWLSENPVFNYFMRILSSPSSTYGSSRSSSMCKKCGYQYLLMIFDFLMPVQFRFEAPKRKQASRKLNSDDVYSEPSQTSKMELLAKIIDDIQLLSFFTKSTIVDVWQGSKTPLMVLTNTARNSVISPNLLVWKLPFRKIRWNHGIFRSVKYKDLPHIFLTGNVI